jgi:hypothetical protein
MIALVGVAMAFVGGSRTASAGQLDAAAAPPASSAPGRGAPYGWYPTNAGDPRYEVRPQGNSPTNAS